MDAEGREINWPGQPLLVTLEISQITTGRPWLVTCWNNKEDETYQVYRKNPKISDTRKFAVITLESEQDGFSLE